MPNIDLSILNQRQTPAFYADTFANRPAPSFVGRIFISTDTFDLYRDTGTAWVLLSPSAAAGVTGTGVANQVAFWSGTTAITGENNLWWDSVNNHFGINTNTPGTALDIHHDQSTLVQLNQTTATNDTRIAFQNSGTALWRIGNFYNAGANDWGIFDVVGAAQPFTIKKTTGQTFIGAETSSSGRLVVNNATGDNHIVVLGANSPSIRVRNNGSTPFYQFGLGLSTAANNFIQGSFIGDFCIFNNSLIGTKQILFGVYNTGSGNTEEAARFSQSKNFLIGQTFDSGEKLQVTGDVKVIGNVTANNIVSSVVPTFTFVTTNGLNPGYTFQSYPIALNLNGSVVSGYTKTGNLVLQNAITITSLTSDVEILVDGNITINNITTFSLPNLVAVLGNTNLTVPLISDISASIPNLQRVGGTFAIAGSTNVLNLNFPQLIYVGGLFLNSNNIPFVTSINFQNLVSVGGNISISTQTSVNIFNFNSLQTVVGTISITSLGSLTTLSLPSLTIIGNSNAANVINIVSCTALTSVTLPSIQRIFGVTSSLINFTSGTPNLNTFTFGSGLKQIGITTGNVVFTSCALTQASVDGILVSLAALDGTNGTTTFNNRTVTITGTSSTPSATGLAAKVTLQARGCVVTNN